MASFGDTMRVLATKPTFWFIAFAAAIKAFIGYGHSPFTASFFLRNHAEAIAGYADYCGGVFGSDLVPTGFLGIALGLDAGVGGEPGTWRGGFMADKYGEDGRRDSKLWPANAWMDKN